MREIEIIMEELKTYHGFNCEDSGCSFYEQKESWEILKYNLIRSIKKEVPEISEDFINILEKS